MPSLFKLPTRNPFTAKPITNLSKPTSPVSSLTRSSPLARQEIAHLLQSHISRGTHYPDFRRFHARIVVSGYRSDVFLNNLLLNAYSKANRVSHARALFDGMHERNLISWSSMISIYAQRGRSEEAVLLFSQFRNSSSEFPNEFILASVLRACTHSRVVDMGLKVHVFSIKAGFCANVYVGTALVDFYSKNREMGLAMLVFDELPVKNSVTWTAIITGYSQIGRGEVSLQLFSQMRKNGVHPDRFVLSSVISACLALEFLKGGMQLHAFVYKHEMEMDTSVNNVLIDLYSKCDKVKIARRIFDLIVVKDVVSWTTMIAGYMQSSCHLEAMDLFQEMMSLSEWRPDGFACASVLNSCGSLMALGLGKQVHGYAIKANLETDEFVSTGLIDMYAKCDGLNDARKTLYFIDGRGVIAYNSMIQGYARHGLLSSAIELFNTMRHNLISPSLLTFVSLLGLSADVSALNHSMQIHGLMIKFGGFLDLLVGSALVDVYSKCSHVEDAKAIFDEMDHRDLVVWNAMISGYTNNGKGERAIKLFRRMCLERVKPDEFTFVAVVNAASGLANMSYGLQFHNHIIKMGFGTEPYVLNGLLDMYAKCGSINEARKLFDEIECRDVVCWNAMISRYAQHGHAEAALHVYKQIISIESKDSGSRVLLSNILASKGMWDESETVREGMEMGGVAKEPGFSWITMDRGKFVCSHQ
ncbi:Pentatricopeptide repeat-containing protein [Acorus gramineus]|uniref:Pentatricopeptide repeat-containing protein n=1 Tax=Acorus gramineus TaxID=55184 RepID=A0AAV9AS32_ACOGR|nr:Pentatricopeptide repeat-containing protein [Acorus gramineus]